MKGNLAAFAALVALCGLAMGQVESSPGYSISFLIDKKDTNQVWGTAVFFHDRIFSDIWVAIIKKLIIDHKRILVADKKSGFISAENQYGDVQYFFREKPGGVEVIFPSAGGLKGVEKIVKGICEEILEHLPKKKD